MMDRDAQRVFDDVTIGDMLPSISIPITLQYLVSEAGANRDLSLIHHDRDVARATGAPDAYMNTFFIAGMFERLLRQWMRLKGRLNKSSNLRLQVFNSVGDEVVFKGRVTELIDAQNRVVIELAGNTDKGVNVTATATVTLPR